MNRFCKLGCFVVGIASALNSSLAGESTPPTGAISAGGSHAVALRSDGRVLSWGINTNGRLGIGNTTQKLSPTLLSGIQSVASVSAGGGHTLALKTDGTLWSWGLNANGQLGDNSITQRTAPVQITTLTTVTTASAGTAHSLAVKQNGTVWAWGLNVDGRLGDNTVTQRLAPVQVSGLTDVIAVSSGSTHSLALKADGTVWAWGDNTNGRLGDGTTVQRLVPVHISGISQVVAISAGATFSLALRSDGTVWSWGDNTNGRLGDGTTTQRLVPTQTNVLASVTAITAGFAHSLALKSDGTVYGWGDNTNGRLGDGTLSHQLSPVSIPGLAGILQIRVGTDYSLALGSDGLVMSWGENASGQLGYGTTLPRKTATQVYKLTHITEVRARGGAGAALQTGGKLFMWGSNTFGQLGDGSTASEKVAGLQQAIANVADIAIGATHVLVAKTDGTVWAWGDNTNGRLGDGTTTQRQLPVQVVGLSGVTRVAAGGTHSLALKSDGTVWAWGDNTNGRLGDGTTTQRLSPVLVTGLTGAIAIGAGDTHSVALKSDGTVRAWGANTNGRLGDGTTTQRLSPVPATGLTQVVAISVGGSHNLALKSTGTAWSWGNNASGRLGDGTTTQKTAAVQVVTITGITALAAGSAHSLAVKSDGTVWAWGSNTNGQVGDGTITNRTSPVQVPGFSGATDVVAGEDNSFALTKNSTVFAWGLCAAGSLGVNEPAISQVANIRLVSIPSDVDGDGLVDSWEIAHLGNLSSNGTADIDADHLTDAQEHFLETLPEISDQDQDYLNDLADPFPVDFFNAETPSVVAVSGNNQTAPPSSVNLQPFDVAVWNSDASFPLVNAPVNFSVSSGGGLLAQDSSPGMPRAPSLQTRADLDGTSQAFYQQPASDQVTSQIVASAGPATVNFSTTSQESPDSDNDGLSDAQESSMGTNPAVADTDGDGIPDELEARLGLNPLLADADLVPSAIGGRRLHLRGDLGVTMASSYVTAWADQSGRGNNAFIIDTSNRPRQFTNITNGKPVIRFDGIDDYLQLPDLMAGAVAGEMFVVSKTTIRVGNEEGLLYLSSSFATTLPGNAGWLVDGFGSTEARESGVTTARLTAFNLYNVSAKSGEWRNSLNGLPLIYSRSNQVAFMPDPTLGIGGGFFKGDVAEVLVFDHVLTEQQRTAMNLYLSNRYGLVANASAPTGLSGTSISSSQTSLRWSGSVPSTSAITYVVESRLAGGDYRVIAEVPNTLSVVDSGLTPGATYDYRIRAHGLNGVRSTYSNTVSVTLAVEEPSMPVDDLNIWLKADAGISDSGSISTWADQSRGKNHAFAIDPATKPVLVANVANGKPVLRFDGVDDLLLLPADAMAGATAGELFLVSRTTTRVGYSESVLTMGSGGSTLLTDYDGAARDSFGSSQLHELVLNTGSLTSFNIYNAASSSGLWQSWCNGSLAARTFVNTVDFGTTLFVGSDSMSFFKGDVAEILVFKRNLTDAERGVVTRYLGAKYALGANAAAPSALTAAAISSSQLSVQWAGAAPGSYAIWYSLERSTNGVAYTVVFEAADSFSFLDTGLVSGTSYSYRIRARSTNGVFSPYSPSILATLPFGGDTFPTSDMHAWFKADAGVGGGAVSTWLDQSGHNNHALVEYPSSQPTRIASAINGGPVLRFDGVSNALSLPANLMNGATAGEVFIVSKALTHGVSQPALLLGFTGATYLPDHDDVLRDGFGSAQLHEIPLDVSALYVFNVYNASSKPGAWQSFLNGNSVAQISSNTVAFGTSFAIGSDWASHFSGDIAEIIVYGRALDAGERATVVTYLASRYNLGGNASAPAVLTATATSNTSVSIQWTGQTVGAFPVLYSLERKTENGGTYTVLAQVTDVFSYLDGSGVQGETYSYRIRARGINGVLSGYSNVATVSLIIPPPSAPTGLSILAQSSTSASISWSFGGPGGSALFTLERAIGAGAYIVVDHNINGLSYLDGNLPAGASCAFRVKAHNQYGESSYTAPVTVVLPQPVAPIISNIVDQHVSVNQASGPMAFTISDADTPNASLMVAAVSSNQILVTSADISLTAGAAPSITVTPAQNQFGSAIITVTVSDGVLSSSCSFVLSVSPRTATAFWQSVFVNAGAALEITLEGSGLFGSPVTFFTDSAPLHGTISGSGATRIYTPVVGFSGIDSFMFHAADDNGPSSPAAVVITVAAVPATLPFVANLEPVEGYTTGSLLNQFGWFATGGVSVGQAATITSENHQELTIAAGDVELLSHTFSSASMSPVYVDFLARPVAGIDPQSSTIFRTLASQVALVGTASSAELWVLDDGGRGWFASGQSLATDSICRTVDWVRLTARENYATNKWDLYLNGRMIAADIAFADSAATSLTLFSFYGHATAAASFDQFYAGPINPLFADVNNNGIDDAWETTHGLSLSFDNRQLSPTSNGITVLQAYLAGTDPQDFYNGAALTLGIISGNNQFSAPSQFNSQAFVVYVGNAAGVPLAGAPVTFTVTSSGGLVAASTTDTPADTLTLHTTSNGTAQAFFLQPAATSATSHIKAAAGSAQVTFYSTTANIDTTDTDGNGLPDVWEMQHFGHYGVDPNADPDGDGIGNLEEFLTGRNPTHSEVLEASGAIRLRVYSPNR